MQSVQYVVECDIGNGGCRGGWPTTAWQYIASYGYVNWNDYGRQYLGVQRACIKPKTKIIKKVPKLIARQGQNMSNDALKRLVAH